MEHLRMCYEFCNEKASLKKITQFKIGSVLVNDFWNTPPQASPPINFVHDEISKFSIYLLLFRVRLG